MDLDSGKRILESPEYSPVTPTDQGMVGDIAAIPALNLGKPAVESTEEKTLVVDPIMEAEENVGTTEADLPSGLGFGAPSTLPPSNTSTKDANDEGNIPLYERMLQGQNKMIMEKKESLNKVEELKRQERQIDDKVLYNLLRADPTGLGRHCLLRYDDGHNFGRPSYHVPVFTQVVYQHMLEENDIQRRGLDEKSLESAVNLCSFDFLKGLKRENSTIPLFTMKLFERPVEYHINDDGKKVIIGDKDAGPGYDKVLEAKADEVIPTYKKIGIDLTSYRDCLSGDEIVRLFNCSWCNPGISIGNWLMQSHPSHACERACTGDPRNCIKVIKGDSIPMPHKCCVKQWKRIKKNARRERRRERATRQGGPIHAKKRRRNNPESDIPICKFDA